MLLAYVDESYNADHYWIAAVIVRDHAVAGLTQDLDRLVEIASATYGTSVNAELHGYDLFHGERDWAPLHNQPWARIWIYSEALTAICASGSRLIVRGLDRKKLRERYVNPFPDHEVVLAHLLERIDEYSQKDHADEPVLVIADEISNSAAYRRQLWRFQREATEGYRSRQITRIVDTIYFAPSTSSRLVQAADLIAFLQQRYRARWAYNGRSDRVIKGFRHSLTDSIAHLHCWDP